VATLSAERQLPALEQAARQFGARLFEAGPGLVTWILLLAPAWIPIIFHTEGALFVASAVLIFDLYWLIRAITLVVGVYSSMLKMFGGMRKDWLAMCRADQATGKLDPFQYILSLIHI